MIKILILILLYIIPAWYNFNWIQKAYYNEKGRWLGLDPELGDIVLTFVPILNLFFLSALLFIRWKHEKFIDNKTNIFKPKKDND